MRRAYREDIDWLRAIAVLAGGAPTRREAFRVAGVSTVVLPAAGAGGIFLSQTPSDADRVALQLESYNTYNYQPVYVSVVVAICPSRQCPLTIDGDIPLSWDHAHLTAEGSVYVMDRLVPMLGVSK